MRFVLTHAYTQAAAMNSSVDAHLAPKHGIGASCADMSPSGAGLVSNRLVDMIPTASAHLALKPDVHYIRTGTQDMNGASGAVPCSEVLLGMRFVLTHAYTCRCVCTFMYCLFLRY